MYLLYFCIGALHRYPSVLYIIYPPTPDSSDCWFCIWIISIEIIIKSTQGTRKNSLFFAHTTFGKIQFGVCHSFFLRCAYLRIRAIFSIMCNQMNVCVPKRDSCIWCYRLFSWKNNKKNSSYSAPIVVSAISSAIIWIR